MEKELNKYMINDIVNIVMVYIPSICLMCNKDVYEFGNCKECIFKVWQLNKCIEVYSDKFRNYNKKKLRHVYKYRRCLENMKIAYEVIKPEYKFDNKKEFITEYQKFNYYMNTDAKNYDKYVKDLYKWENRRFNGDGADLQFLELRYDKDWLVMENDIKI